MAERRPAFEVRLAREADLTEIALLVDEFVRGHPAENHPRSSSDLRKAYLGRAPVAELVVAEKGGRIVGMSQWPRYYDMFWSKFGGRADGLFVRPEIRGQGIGTALLATICERIRSGGGEFLYGLATDETRPLYERCAISGDAYVDFYLSAEAFQQTADLSGLSGRELLAGLPDPTLNRVPASRRE